MLTQRQKYRQWRTQTKEILQLNIKTEDLDLRI